MKKLLIKNALLVNEGATFESDLLIAGERIEKIAADIPVSAEMDVLDAAGRYLIPGMIDDQVHFREPGLTAKGDLATESAAAVAGGITSFMDMPNVNPQTTTREALAAKYQLAAGRCTANYGFHLGATNRNIEEIKALQVNEGSGIKAFMGASTGDMLVDDPAALDLLFEHAPVIVLTHCEHSPTIWENEALARTQYGDDVPMSEHPAIRSAAACLQSSSLATSLANRHDALLHVLHLTTGVEMALFKPGHRSEKRITGEVCVHHLWFDESRYAELGTRIKCNPAIKTADDRAALLKALAEDRLDIIATDHAPHTAAEKNNTYFKAPAGLPLVQHALLCLFDLAAQGHFSVEKLVDKTSHAVADIFGLPERGYLREGYYADLALVDPQKPYTVDASNVLCKVGWSPFEGQTFGSTIDVTVVNGEIVWQDGRLTGAVPGQRLQFARAR
ncbi:MAG: dihydroorotase [Woeseia sp.]|nr:dihydroorotase [Woeseia sp.]MBT8095846.1 dihydroorotase [Woeseia sp.]NNE61877.1 dihydroorotase [Woeseia sp.]NNL55100.1 dihydroorotase [Woeseia sp.]